MSKTTNENDMSKTFQLIIKEQAGERNQNGGSIFKKHQKMGTWGHKKGSLMNVIQRSCLFDKKCPKP